MKKLYTIIAFLFACASLFAQGQLVPGIRNIVYTGEILFQEQQVEIQVMINPGSLELSSQEMMVFTPVFVSDADGEQVRFNPVVLTGGRRLKSLKREMGYGNEPFEKTPEVLQTYHNGRMAPIRLDFRIPYKEWMRRASLVMLAEATGCVDCESQTEQVVLVGALPEPEFRVTYIIPEAETKTFSERYSARLNYVVDKWDLLSDFKDNARVLSEVDQTIRPILNNPDFKITHCAVDGYASPEGNYERNLLLARNRAESFLNYLSQRYNFDRSSVNSRGHGEDWQGLRDTVSNMPWLTDGARVVEIINNTFDVAQRKSRLQALSGGATYRDLLASVYPSLRRNEFEITYEIRPYSVVEALEVFKTNPRQLSLNELFLVAQEHPAGSPEFNRVFDTAVRMFPESEIAKINAGAMEIEQGAQTLAAERLRNTNTPEGWNNAGVAYALLGEYRLAAEYLGKAAAAGEINGAHNLEQLRLVFSE